jgi:hypothetical protein
MGRPAIDILGHRFGKLRVLSCKGLVGKEMTWLCICDCGTEKVLTGSNLRSGKTNSCGCLQKEPENNPAFLHGQCRRLSITKEYRAYASAKARCTNSKHASFPAYGGRGIKFLFNTFEEFINEIGLAPSPQHSVDRIETNGNYEMGNVRWATKKQQTENRRKFGALTTFTTEELEAELTRRKNARPYRTVSAVSGS